MIRGTTRSLLVCAGCALSFNALTALAGDTNPPPGPVSGTMKTLDQIEPRTVVNDLAGAADALVVISQPGRYYLTDDLIVPAGQNGIVVDLPAGGSVELTLNGYSLIGMPGALDGIRVVGNGLSQSMSIDDDDLFASVSSSITGFSGDGIHIEAVDRVSISGIRVENCGGDGIDATAPGGGGKFKIDIQSCPVANANVHGIALTGFHDCRIRRASIDNSGGDGIRAIAPGSGVRRIRMASVDMSSCAGNGITANGYVECECTHLIANDCGGDGVNILSAPGGSVRVGGGDNDNWDFQGGSSIRNCLGGGVVVGNGAVIRVGGIDIQSTGTDAIDITCNAQDRAEVRVEKFNVRQDFGPQQGGVRVEGAGSVVLAGGTLRDCGGGAVYVVQYRESDFSFLNIGSSGIDGVLLEPSAGPTDQTSTRLRDVQCFGSVGDNVRFNPLATAGTHSLEISGGVFNGAGANGVHVSTPGGAGGGGRISVRCDDSTAMGNAGDGLRIRGGHDLMMSSIRNTRAIANGGSGVDVDLYATTIHSELTLTSSNIGSSGLDGVCASVHAYMGENNASCNNTLNGFDLTFIRASESNSASLSNGGAGYKGRGPAGATERKKCFTSHFKCCLNSGPGIDVQGVDSDHGELRCSENAGGGVLCVGGDLSIHDSTINDNTGNGISMTAVAGDNLYFVDSNNNRNSANGLVMTGGTVDIRKCVCRDNLSNGMVLQSMTGGRISECTASGNANIGIWTQDLFLSGRIENNTCDNNAGGLQVDGTGNYVLYNSATLGPLGDILIAPNNADGARVATGMVPTNTNPQSNVSH